MKKNVDNWDCDTHEDVGRSFHRGEYMGHERSLRTALRIRSLRSAHVKMNWASFFSVLF